MNIIIQNYFSIKIGMIEYAKLTISTFSEDKLFKLNSYF